MAGFGSGSICGDLSNVLDVDLLMDVGDIDRMFVVLGITKRFDDVEDFFVSNESSSIGKLVTVNRNAKLASRRRQLVVAVGKLSTFDDGRRRRVRRSSSINKWLGRSILHRACLTYELFQTGSIFR